MKRFFSSILMIVGICTTIFADVPEGILNGRFSIEENKQIRFSKGNLQYYCSSATWKFADSQLTFIGEANTNISTSYEGWIDLFGWSNETTNYGITGSNSSNDYSGAFYDWGNAAIVNGGNKANLWRTLTSEEFNYLLKSRNDAQNLFGTAKIGTIEGIVLLPDTWKAPDGVTFISGTSDFAEITSDNWEKMQHAGAVFLPKAGVRAYAFNSITYLPTLAYWTATTENESNANCLILGTSGIGIQAGDRFQGLPVRLVYDVPSEDTPTALQDVENVDIYTENGRIVCNSEFQIFDLLGRDVTRMNGQLNGIYVVKVGDKAQKVIVR